MQTCMAGGGACPAEGRESEVGAHEVGTVLGAHPAGHLSAGSSENCRISNCHGAHLCLLCLGVQLVVDAWVQDSELSPTH